MPQIMADNDLNAVINVFILERCTKVTLTWFNRNRSPGTFCLHCMTINMSVVKMY